MYYLFDGKDLYIDNRKDIKMTNTLKYASVFTEDKAIEVLNNLPLRIKNKHTFELLEIADEQQETNVVKKIDCSTNRKKFSSNKREDVYTKSKGVCAICGKFIPHKEFTVDHIIPLAKGGTNDISNLQASCGVCNKIKTDILPDDFMNKITEILTYQLSNNYNKDIINKFASIKDKNSKSKFKRILEVIKSK